MHASYCSLLTAHCALPTRHYSLLTTHYRGGNNYNRDCCNGYCCSEAYFGAMKQLPCTNNEGCQVKKICRSLRE